MRVCMYSCNHTYMLAYILAYIHRYKHTNTLQKYIPKRQTHRQTNVDSNTHATYTCKYVDKIQANLRKDVYIISGPRKRECAQGWARQWDWNDLAGGEPCPHPVPCHIRLVHPPCHHARHAPHLPGTLTLLFFKLPVSLPFPFQFSASLRPWEFGALVRIERKIPNPKDVFSWCLW